MLYISALTSRNFAMFFWTCTGTVAADVGNLTLFMFVFGVYNSNMSWIRVLQLSTRSLCKLDSLVLGQTKMYSSICGCQRAQASAGSYCCPRKTLDAVRAKNVFFFNSGIVTF